MAVINEPSPLETSFAENGDYNEIPASNDGTEGLASWSLGFPEITQTPLAQGGLPPQRGDFNGIFKAITDFLRYYQSGGVFTYNEEMDYKKNALVVYNNRLYFCTADNGAGTSNGQHLPTETGYWLPVPMPNVDNNFTATQSVSGITAKTGANVNLSVADSVTVPTPDGDMEAVNKKYVDTVTGNLLVSDNTWTGDNTFSGAVNLDGAVALDGTTLTINDSSGTAKATLNSSGYTGNAATATKLYTARTLNVTDADGTNTGTGASFNGTANATIKLPSTIKASITGNCSGSSGSCTGNAATATQVQVLDFSGSSKNLNNVAPTSSQRIKWAYATSSTVNVPGRGSYIVGCINAGWQGQFAIPGNSSGGIWFRGFSAANTWGNWARILTTYDVGAIASYSVSNSSSWYVKFAGNPGLIIQGGKWTKSSKLTDDTITFPLSFGTVFTVNITYNMSSKSGSGDGNNDVVWSVSTTGFHKMDDGNVGGYYIAIGKA